MSKIGIRSTWKICAVCGEEFLAKTAKICYACRNKDKKNYRISDEGIVIYAKD